MLGKLLHTCLITEDRAFGTLTGGVDGEDSQTSALLSEHMHAKLVDGGGFSSAWHTTDTHTYTVAAIRQTLVDDLLGLGLMIGVHTLDEGDSLGEHGDIALEDPFHHLCR